MTPLPLAMLVAVVGPAQAADVPAVFYNMPGATPAALAAELDRCRAITTGATGATVEGKALAPPLGHAAGERRDPLPVSTIDTCMVARGWHVYALGARDRRALAALAPDARRRTLAALVGVVRPARGRLVRSAPSLQLRLPDGAGPPRR